MDVTTQGDVLTIGGQIQAAAAKVRTLVPSAYRMARKGSGELILQGWFSWQEGCQFGGDWKEIPIAQEDDTTPPNGMVTRHD